MGVGFVSALSRSFCIVARKSSASVGIGAWLRSAITGSRASCIAFAVMFRIFGKLFVVALDVEVWGVAFC